MSAATMSPKGIQYSAILHAILFALLFLGLPSFLHRQPDMEPQAISVEILPVAPISNVKPQEQEEKPEPKKPVAQEKTEKKAVPEAHKEEPKAEEVPPEKISAKEVVKKKEEKKPKEKPKKKDEDLDSILKSVKDTAKAEAAKKPSEKTAEEPAEHKAVSQNYNSAMPLSMSEKDAIRNQLQKCWDPPAGARDAYNLAVNLHITLTEDGTVTTVERMGDDSRYASDSFFRAAADSAIRAVHRCSPFKGLPADKYASWSDMTFTFDPKEMLY